MSTYRAGGEPCAKLSSATSANVFADSTIQYKKVTAALFIVPETKVSEVLKREATQGHRAPDSGISIYTIRAQMYSLRSFPKSPRMTLIRNNVAGAPDKR